MAGKTVWTRIEVRREVEAIEMFESVVKDFGTGGAHIPFTAKCLHQKVLVIPLGKGRS